MQNTYQIYYIIIRILDETEEWAEEWAEIIFNLIRDYETSLSTMC